MSGHGKVDSRESAVATVLAVLATGQGVLVVGEPGAGRTHLIRSALAQLPDESRRSIWVGDDVHRLDAQLGSDLIRSTEQKRIIPVITAAARRPLGAVAEKMCRDGLVVRIDLPDLDPSAVLAAVQTFLGGRLDPAAVPAFVPQRSGGDLVVLQEVVREAQAAGALVERNGSWGLTGHSLHPDPLRRLLRSRLSALTTLTPVSETLLDIIGLAPEMSVEQVEVLLEALVDGDTAHALERLEEDGVIDVLGRDGSFRVRIHDAVIELIIPQTIGQLRRRRLTTAVVEHLRHVPPERLTESELACLTRYAAPLGVPIEADVLTRAANAALRRSRRELAFHLASAAVEGGGGSSAGLALAAAEAQLGRVDAAKDRLRGLEGDFATEPGFAAAAATLSRLIDERSRDALAAWHIPSDWSGDGDVFALGATLRLDSARDIMTPAEIRSAVSVPVDPNIVIQGEVMAQTALVACLQGDLSRADDLLDDAEAILAPAGADLLRIQWTRAYIRCHDEPLDPWLRVLSDMRESAASRGHGVVQGHIGLAIGGMMVGAGRVTQGAVELQRALDLLEQNGLVAAATDTRVELAVATAMAGDGEGAMELLRPVLDPSPEMGFLLARTTVAMGVSHAAAGRMGEAAEAFIQAAGIHAALGLRLHELSALHHAARAGAAQEVLSRVDELGTSVEGRSMAICVRHTRALARSQSLDPALPHSGEETRALAREFVETAEEASVLGWPAPAAEAFFSAAELFAACGDDRDASAARRRGEDHLVVCGLTSLPFTRDPGVVRLSERESEIAGLAAAGASNRQIADSLVLSVRTVETHLQRVYRKLGIRGRSELPDAIGSRTP